MNSTQRSQLETSIESAVRLLMSEYRKRGGPTEAERAAAIEGAQILATQGEALLHASDTPGKTAEIFMHAARGIAVLAFSPGGIAIFGMHFEAKLQEISR